MNLEDTPTFAQLAALNCHKRRKSVQILPIKWHIHINRPAVSKLILTLTMDVNDSDVSKLIITLGLSVSQSTPSPSPFLASTIEDYSSSILIPTVPADIRQS
jgi:hypothetical protein